MIVVTLKEFAQQRGIKLSVNRLERMGIPRTTAYRIINNKVKSLSLQVLEDLCILFRCTPRELLGYLPDASGPLDAAHPLHEWSDAPYINAIDKLHTLNPEQLMQVNEYIRRLGG